MVLTSATTGGWSDTVVTRWQVASDRGHKMLQCPAPPRPAYLVGSDLQLGRQHGLGAVVQPRPPPSAQPLQSAQFRLVSLALNNQLSTRYQPISST